MVDSAKPGDVITLPAGEYRQKLIIRTPGITIKGAGRDRTKIVWDDYARKMDKNQLEYNTFRTWTIAVCAPDVTITDIHIENDALFPERKGQEVALSVIGDGFKMEDCTLSSTQDTLFCGPLPEDLIERYDGFLPDELRQNGPFHQTFNGCLIEGTVDFIFGCAQAEFNGCEIRSIKDARGCGYAAAPAHPLSDEEGFTFADCRFTHGPGVEQGSIYLARPWRDYGMCRFISCAYEDHINPLGFDKWNDTDRDKTARFYETPPVPGRVSWAKSM